MPRTRDVLQGQAALIFVTEDGELFPDIVGYVGDKWFLVTRVGTDNSIVATEVSFAAVFLRAATEHSVLDLYRFLGKFGLKPRLILKRSPIDAEGIATVLETACQQTSATWHIQADVIKGLIDLLKRWEESAKALLAEQFAGVDGPHVNSIKKAIDTLRATINKAERLPEVLPPVAPVPKSGKATQAAAELHDAVIALENVGNG